MSDVKPIHGQQTQAAKPAWGPPSRLHGDRPVMVLDEAPIMDSDEHGILREIYLTFLEHFYLLSDIARSLLFENFRLGSFYINPESRARRVTQVSLIIVMLYQATVIPVRIVWGFHIWPMMHLWIAFDYLLDCIYILDIVMNFMTAYNQEGTGKLITNRAMISRKYMRWTFVFHFLASVPYDLLAFNYGVEYLPHLRLNRLIRLPQITKAFAVLEKGFNHHLVRILRLLFLMLIFAHWFGCGWFYIAKLEKNPEVTWAAVAGILEADFTTQYITSAYWALVVMTTVGFGDIVPVTNYEKVFTMVTMISGVTIYATIFGNMATMIAQLDASATRYREKLDNLKEFMKYRSLPSYLRSRIMNYHEIMWTRNKGIDEAQILQELPSSLRSEIALYLNRELVENVPLFKGTNEPGFINSLVVMLKPQVALEGDYIIHHGEIGREMYFISRGEVEVVSGDGKTVFAVLKEGSYFGEIALLFAARRNASIRAIGYCELFMLTKEDFDSVLTFFPSFAESMRVIARQKIEEEKKKREAAAGLTQGAPKDVDHTKQGPAPATAPVSHSTSVVTQHQALLSSTQRMPNQSAFSSSTDRASTRCDIRDGSRISNEGTYANRAASLVSPGPEEPKHKDPNTPILRKASMKPRRAKTPSGSDGTKLPIERKDATNFNAKPQSFRSDQTSVPSVPRESSSAARGRSSIPTSRSVPNSLSDRLPFTHASSIALPVIESPLPSPVKKIQEKSERPAPPLTDVENANVSVSKDKPPGATEIDLSKSNSDTENKAQSLSNQQNQQEKYDIYVPQNADMRLTSFISNARDASSPPTGELGET